MQSSLERSMCQKGVSLYIVWSLFYLTLEVHITRLSSMKKCKNIYSPRNTEDGPVHTQAKKITKTLTKRVRDCCNLSSSYYIIRNCYIMRKKWRHDNALAIRSGQMSTNTIQIVRTPNSARPLNALPPSSYNQNLRRADVRWWHYTFERPRLPEKAADYWWGWFDTRQGFVHLTKRVAKVELRAH